MEVDFGQLVRLLRFFGPIKLSGTGCVLLQQVCISFLLKSIGKIQNLVKLLSKLNYCYILCVRINDGRDYMTYVLQSLSIRQKWTLSGFLLHLLPVMVYRGVNMRS